MSLLNSTLSVLRRITIVVAIAGAFLFGLATTVYLSLLSPEVTVPDVLGKDRFEAEKILDEAGLNFRVRATRPSSQVKSDTVLFQLPRAGEVVKAGQTVAMDISRATKEGEASQVVTAPVEEKKSDANTNTNENRSRRSKSTNKNANENGNTNANRSANASRVASEENLNAAKNEDSPAVNRNDKGRNSDDDSQNKNMRPTPKPSPAVKNDNRDNR